MAATDIDALIEDGLTRYGRGDLDGALLVWEEALGIEPDNEQANSYVDYVRQNYDLLTGSELISNEAHAPFGIEDDEYTVEIIEGAVLAPATPKAAAADALDDGWFIDDSAPVPDPARALSRELPVVPAVVEMEADEPPPSFNSLTREYQATTAAIAMAAIDTTSYVPADLPDATVSSGRPFVAADDDDGEPEIEVSVPVPVATSDIASGEFPSGGHTPGFGEAQNPEDSTPVGFAQQVTDVRMRGLGFVKPVESKPPEAPPPEPSPEPKPEPPPEPPPEPVAATAIAAEPATEPAIEPAAEPAAAIEPAMPTPTPELPTRAPTHDKIESAIAAAEITPTPGADPAASDFGMELGPPGAPPPPSSAFGVEATATEHSAIGPKPVAPSDPQHEDNDDIIPPPSPSALTRELPLGMQLPVFADERNRTRDLSWEIGQDHRPTQKLPLERLAGIDISAPTRELGLRPTRTDIVTSRIDPRNVPPPTAGGAGDITRADLVLPFDPMDARAAQILDEIDDKAPAEETREDRTRRRITALIEKSAYWQRGLDLEKSVTAIDLALSEDPNSALAQKLIHRNRDAIMTAFQSYIGDLSRAPLLARPLHELASAPISPRAAFLLSRVDGTMTLDEILDVSGMPRLEAFRYLSQLLLRGILK